MLTGRYDQVHRHAPEYVETGFYEVHLQKWLLSVQRYARWQMRFGARPCYYVRLYKRAEAWNRVVVKVGTEQDVGRQWCNRLYRTIQKEVALL
jgi:hypothetical protein